MATTYEATFPQLSYTFHRLITLVQETNNFRKQESRAAARKPRDAASVLFR